MSIQSLLNRIKEHENTLKKQEIKLKKLKTKLEYKKAAKHFQISKLKKLPVELRNDINLKIILGLIQEKEFQKIIKLVNTFGFIGIRKQIFKLLLNSNEWQYYIQTKVTTPIVFQILLRGYNSFSTSTKNVVYNKLKNWRNPSVFNPLIFQCECKPCDVYENAFINNCMHIFNFVCKYNNEFPIDNDIPDWQDLFNAAKLIKSEDDCCSEILSCLFGIK